MPLRRGTDNDVSIYIYLVVYDIKLEGLCMLQGRLTHLPMELLWLMLNIQQESQFEEQISWLRDMCPQTTSCLKK